jgi:hypothetical protein
MQHQTTAFVSLSASARRGTALAVLAIWSASLATTQLAWADSAPNTEHIVKTVFIYNLLKFVDWPKGKIGDSNEPLIIGVIGTDVFENAFDLIEKKTIDDRAVVVKRFKGLDELEKAGQKEPSDPHPQTETIRTSHLLFVCPSERQRIKEILQSVEGHHVLTVADTAGFLEAGGVINLLLEDEKVRFEANLTAAKQAGLQIRSRLLRLAKRTYKPPER